MARSQAYYADALAIARASGDRRRIADALYNLSFAYIMPRSNLPEGRLVIEEAAEIYRDLGDDGGLVNALWGLGNLYFFDESWERAAGYYGEALELARRTHNAFMVGWALHMGGSSEIKLGRYREAYDHLREGLLSLVADRETTGIVLSLDDFAELANAVGDLPRSFRLAGAARRLQDETATGLAGFANELMSRDRLATGAFAPDEIERLRAEGRALTIDEAVELALGIEVPDGPADAPTDRTV